VEDQAVAQVGAPATEGAPVALPTTMAAELEMILLHLTPATAR
jgi:hypothetical protein